MPAVRWLCHQAYELVGGECEHAEHAVTHPFRGATDPDVATAELVLESAIGRAHPPYARVWDASLECKRFLPRSLRSVLSSLLLSKRGTLVHDRINTDLLSGGRTFVGWFGTRGQVLSCVRPHQLRHITRRGPVWRYAGRVQIVGVCSKARERTLVFPTPSR